MLTTGRQLAAARALLGLDLATLARASSLEPADVEAMEGAGAGQIEAPRAQLAALEAALRAAGAEILGDGRPGVRLAGDAGAADSIEIEDLTTGNDGGAG